MEAADFKNALKDSIAEGNFDKAIDSLLLSTKNWQTDLHSETILVSSRLRELNRKQRMNIEDPKTLEISRIQIGYALLKIIDLLDEKIVLEGSQLEFNFEELKKDISEGNYISVIAKLKPYLEKNPNHAKAWFALGINYYHISDFNKAIASFSKTIRLEQNFADAYFYRSLCYSSVGNYDASFKDHFLAIDLYTSQINADIDATNSYFKRGLLFDEQDISGRAESDLLIAIEKFNEIIAEEHQNDHALLNRGMCHVRLKNNTKAIQDLTICVESMDENPFVYHELATAYFNSGNKEKAIHFSSQAININPRDSKFYFARSTYYFQKRQFHKALSDIEMAAELNPDNPLNYFIRGAVLGHGNNDLMMFNFKKGIKLCTDILFLNSNFYSFKKIRGISYSLTKEFDKALLDLNEALIFSPNDMDCLEFTAITYINLRDWSNAKRIINYALSVEPKNINFVLLKGELLAHDEQPTQVIEWSNEAIEIDAYNPKIYVQKSVAYLKIGEYNLSLQEINKAIHLDENNIDYRTHRANVYEKMNNFEAAIEEAKKVIEIHPQNSEAYSILAFSALVFLKDNHLAVKYISQAIELNPQEESYYSRRILINYFAKNYANAISEATSMINKGLGIEDSLVMRGHCYFDLEDYKAANEDFIKAFELNINNVVLNNMLARTFSKLNNDEGAIKLYTKTIKKFPTDSELYQNRGCAYARVGEWKRSIKDLSKAIELTPANASNYWQRAEIYWAENEDLGKALNDINKAISMDPKIGKYYLSRGQLLLAINPQNKDVARKDFAKAVELQEPGAEDALNSTYGFWDKLFK